MKRLGLIVAGCALFSSAFAQGTDNEFVYKQLKPVDLVRFVPSGGQARISSDYSTNPNCTSAGAVTVQVLQKPSHGEVMTALEDGFTTFDSDNVRSKCNLLQTPVTNTYYKAQPGFVGEDRLQLLIIYSGSGNANLGNYTLIVR